MFLTDRHFDAVVYHLRKIMEELALSPEIVAEVLSLVESTRKDPTEIIQEAE